MNRTLRRSRLAAIWLATSLAACSSPDPVLYTISPVQGATRTGAPGVVVVQTVSLARYLDRAHIVKSSENNRLDVQSNDWWGEPLAAMLRRVLRQELGQRLPQSTVLSESSAVTASPDATVDVDLQRLDEDAAGNLLLEAQVSVSFKGRREAILRSFRFSVPSGGPAAAAAKPAGAGDQVAAGIFVEPTKVELDNRVRRR